MIAVEGVKKNKSLLRLVKRTRVRVPKSDPCPLQSAAVLGKYCKHQSWTTDKWEKVG